MDKRAIPHQPPGAGDPGQWRGGKLGTGRLPRRYTGAVYGAGAAGAVGYQAFEALYVAHGPELRKVARRLTRGDRAWAEELESDTWVRILTKLDSYEPALRFVPWAQKVMFHLYLSDFAQRATRRQALSRRLGLREVPGGPASEEGGGLEAELGWSDSARDLFGARASSVWDDPTGESGTDDVARLLRALEALPKQQRLVITLRDLGGLSQKETAEVLGIAEGTVGSSRSRGLAALRTTLGRWHDGLGGTPALRPPGPPPNPGSLSRTTGDR